MAATEDKKKKKGKKGVTLSLNSFLADSPSAPPSGGGGGGGSSYGGGGGSYGGSGGGSYGGGRDRDSGYKSKVNWAEEMEDQDADDGDSYGGYGSSAKSNIDRSKLPTAPRAARGPDIDLSKVPQAPPYKAYLGNLPYDISQDDIEMFFGKLRVIGVSLPQEQGRQKGFGYAEFEDRQSLIDALSMNDESLRNRKVRVDLAAQTSSDRDRDGGFRRRDDGDDKTSGDWRRKEDRPQFEDRSNDRGFDRRDRFDDRDNNRDRGYFRGDRDRDRGGGGFDRFDRDKGFGGGRDEGRRSFGTGYGRDNRDRYEPPRDRGYEPPRDRGYEPPRDRGYEPPRDRGYEPPRDRGYEPPRDRGYDRGPPPPREDYERDTTDSGRDGAKERPKLNLQKRSKPIEAPSKGNESRSSIFGSAKPVDTAAKEREIEQRLIRQRDQEKRQEDAEKENRERVNSGPTSQPARTRRESSGSQDGSSRRERKLSSSSSGKGIRTVAPPPGSGSARVRRDSALSDEEDVFHADKENKSLSPAQTPPKAKDPDAKVVPAPPPKENIWEKRKTGSSGTTSPGVTSPKAEPVKSDQSGDRTSSTDAVPREKHSENSTSSKSSQDFVPAEPPKENIWERRKQQRKDSDEDRSEGQNAPTRERGGGSSDRGRGAPRGRGGPEKATRKDREKPLPKSIDEMPTFEENKTKDFSDTNKFSTLMADEDDTPENGNSD